MFRSMGRISSIVLLLVMSGVAVAQSEFSADIVNNNREMSGKRPTKVYFSKDKVRIDSQDTDDRSGGGSVILDLNNQSWVVLMAKQHMYMEMPAQMMEKRGIYDFFRTGDVENACSDWLKMAANKGGTCHKVGSETVNGRNTVKYEGTNAKGEAGQMWLDPKLRFPVKWQGANDKGGELRNIQEGSQPGSLFEIPAGYQKFDMGSMMQQRK